MCVSLMGDGASTTMAGKALIRGVQRAIQGMPEAELRANLTDIRARLDEALTVPQTVDFGAPLPLDATAWTDASNDSAAFSQGD